MGNWSQGYMTEIEYQWTFSPEMSPTHLGLVCLQQGFLPPAIDQPYTYCELGCGMGLTANILAASNPRGSFWGIDYNPTHIASALDLAHEGELDNIRFIESSLCELESLDLPDLDFICMHGVWSWINDENREAIRRFIASHLAPGGIAFVSYNSTVGWEGQIAVGRLLKEIASASNGPVIKRLAHAIGSVRELIGQGRGFFHDNFAAQAWLANIIELPTHYLAHEYLNDNWKPFYFRDVANTMTSAGTSYVGSTYLVWNMDRIILGEAIDLVERYGDPMFTQLVKNIAHPHQMRRDVFVRAEPGEPGEVKDLLMAQRFCLTLPSRTLSDHEQTLLRDVAIDDRLLNAVVEALSEGPLTIAELSETTAGEDFSNGGGESSPISQSSRALASRGFGGTRADPEPATVGSAPDAPLPPRDGSTQVEEAPVTQKRPTVVEGRPGFFNGCGEMSPIPESSTLKQPGRTDRQHIAGEQERSGVSDAVLTRSGKWGFLLFGLLILGLAGAVLLLFFARSCVAG